MAVVSMKELLEAGVHFGHQTRRWNPKMAPYILLKEMGFTLLTYKRLFANGRAYNFVRDIAAEGKEVLFVGTKNRLKRLLNMRHKDVACIMSTRDGWWNANQF